MVFLGEDRRVAVGGKSHIRRGLAARHRWAASATMLLLLSQLFGGPRAQAQAVTPGEPRPIPTILPGEVLDPSLHHDFHVTLPELEPTGFNDPSTMTDFQGVAGAAHVTGTGTAIDPSTGVSTRLNFDADMRIMQGSFVGKDGKLHSGTFGFI
jgi:hypothetical protein